jgi:hypothetical protein
MKVNKMKQTLAVLTLLACIAVASISQGEENGAVFGQGAIPCQKFLKASKGKKNDYLIWVQGYLTAYNAIAPDVTNVLEGKDFYWVLERLEQLCKLMPEDYFNEAAVHLVGELHPQGIRIAPPTPPKEPRGANKSKKTSVPTTL